MQVRTRVSVNSAALHNPQLIQEAAYKFGSQCVVCAIDAKRTRNGSWTVYLNGGPRGIREKMRWNGQWEAEKLGAGEILLTSMDL